jgi:hypothetical protein
MLICMRQVREICENKELKKHTNAVLTLKGLDNEEA